MNDINKSNGKWTPARKWGVGLAVAAVVAALVWAAYRPPCSRRPRPA